MTTSSPSPEGAAMVRPILKWAGGKRQLLPTLRPYYPSSFSRYLEPFLGSGAVFLDCHNHGLLDACDVHLSDINADVIGCYRMVRDDVEAVIEALRRARSGPPRGWHAAFLRGPRRAVQRAPARRPRLGRPGERLHAGARGHAHLPQPNGLQRAVPPELARRIQRPGRTLRAGDDLRCARTSGDCRRRSAGPD